MGRRKICFAVAIVVVVVVDHDVGAAAGAQFACAVASAAGGVAIVLLQWFEDQFFSGFGEQKEEDETSEDENPNQGSELPGEWDQNQCCHLLTEIKPQTLLLHSHTWTSRDSQFVTQ